MSSRPRSHAELDQPDSPELAPAQRDGIFGAIDRAIAACAEILADEESAS